MDAADCWANMPDPTAESSSQHEQPRNTGNDASTLSARTRCSTVTVANEVGHDLSTNSATTGIFGTIPQWFPPGGIQGLQRIVVEVGAACYRTAATFAGKDPATYYETPTFNYAVCVEDHAV